MNKKLLKMAEKIAKSEAADAALDAAIHKLQQGKFDSIKHITRLGQYKMFRPLNRRDYELQLSGFKNMPTWDEMLDDEGAGDFRILLSPIEIWIETKYAHIIYRFERGFIWDLASVPKRLRSIVDNDDAALMDAAICHDYNFEMWREMRKLDLFYFDYKQSNALFYHMVKCRSNRFKAAICWLGVTNRIAKHFWDKDTTVFNADKCSMEVLPV